MSTYRERREAKAERLRMWAENREAKASAVIEHNRVYTGDIAFNTQPGHIPLRARVIRQNDRAMESLSKAGEMRRRAVGIEAAADQAIYFDDPDAVERLEERLAGLEAERDRIKAYNVSCRKAAKAGGVGDVSLLDDAQRASLESVKRHCPYQLGVGDAMPGYALSNLSGNIKRNRDRLQTLRGER